MATSGGGEASCRPMPMEAATGFMIRNDRREQPANRVDKKEHVTFSDSDSRLASQVKATRPPMPPPNRRITAPSQIMKRSIIIQSHKTSVSLENEFWAAMKQLAKSRRKTIAEYVEEIDARRSHQNLSSAIRIALLEEARAGNIPLVTGEPPPKPRRKKRFSTT